MFQQKVLLTQLRLNLWSGATPIASAFARLAKLFITSQAQDWKQMMETHKVELKW